MKIPICIFVLFVSALNIKFACLRFQFWTNFQISIKTTTGLRRDEFVFVVGSHLQAMAMLSQIAVGKMRVV